MVYLRELTAGDIPLINKWRNDKSLINLLGANFRFINLETDEEWFLNYQRSRANNVRCAICLEDHDEVIGLVSLTGIDQTNRSAEFHIMIGSEEYRNAGLGKEAIKLMLEHGFNNLNLNRIYLSVIEDNIRAQKAYEKAGFTTEGILRKVVYKNGQYKNEVLMSILAEEYKSLE